MVRFICKYAFTEGESAKIEAKFHIIKDAFEKLSDPSGIGIPFSQIDLAFVSADALKSKVKGVYGSFHQHTNQATLPIEV